MPKQHIHCTVSNCYYWETGDLCAAEEILITSDQLAREYPESVDAHMVKQLSAEYGDTPVENCMASCCKTFRRKEAGAGPIKRLQLAQVQA